MVHAELTVAAIVACESRYLVVEEIARGRRVVNQPAGHVEPGETILDAAIRETREESAWRFHPTGIVGFYYMPHADGRHTLRVALAGQVDDHRPRQALDDGIITTHWLTRGELGERDDLRSALVLRAIDDYESQPLMPLARLTDMHDAP
ncbi:NUDIX domain-containing protein [Salinisphaera sp. Q1T1-3]|uniref:NUDIX domain-containing protein n=1 Tax=Salinisphaera sp. Q1T1-3 TaxID=2321229 RepID=UPI000E74228D|nr:NUDIX hydrolase [Salinisphaera sp. Q1T1-3]RJS95088.1 NUDIX hydrolase [Salinisphaera sp. Q1T1-3]